MHVKIERTGGHAGVLETVTEYDTDDLPEEEAAEIHDALAMVAAAWDHGGVGGIGDAGDDLTAYRITVNDNPLQVYLVPEESSPGLMDPMSVLLHRTP